MKQWRDQSYDFHRQEVLNVAMAEWVNGLAPWSVIAHLTFRWCSSMPSTQRIYERFMREEAWGVSNFYAVEQNPSRDGYHVHALWANTRNLSRKLAWAEWFDRYGRNRIEPVNNQGDVAAYCAKYVTKEGAWWNVRLLGGVHPAQKELVLR